MKKGFSALLVFLLVFSLGLSPALAVGPDDGVEANEGEPNGEGEEGLDVLTPDLPFYFVKRFLESVRLWLTFDQEKRVELLEELAEERLKEWEALNDQYDDGELTDSELEILENALDDLIYYVEWLVVALGELDELEAEGIDEGVTDPLDDGEDEGQEHFADKYLWRIAHLGAIAERAPLSAQFGLERAIANAWRQRERMIEKGKLPPDEPEEPEIEETGGAIVITEEDEGNDVNGDDPEALESETGEPEDKYLWRIAHLTAILETAPAAAQFGLERAIANAERQRDKAIEKGKIDAEEELDLLSENDTDASAAKVKKDKPPKPPKLDKRGGPPGSPPGRK